MKRRGRKQMLSVCLALILGLTCTTRALARDYFDRHWAVGEYTCVLTEEDRAHAAALLEAALEDSKDSSVRKGYDLYSYEAEYENYLSVSKDGPLPEQQFDDIGSYGYVIGLPDAQAILQEEAQAIAYRVLQEQYQATDEELTQVLPRCSYWVYAPENPIWCVSFSRYDESVELGFRVELFAHDGSVWGVKKTEAFFG